MKRPFFILFVLLYSVVGAQNTPVFSLKPSLGFNGCQIHGDPYDGYDKLGLFTGVAVNGRISDQASFEVGFYFSQKGARHNSNPDKGDYSFFRVRLNYIDMPILFRYKIVSKRYPIISNFFFTVGPSVAYLISDNVNVNYVDQTPYLKFNKMEVGVNAGIGRQLGKKWLVELRTSNSVTPILTFSRQVNPLVYPNVVARAFNKGYYNNILTFLLTYQIDLGSHGQH